MRHVLLPPATLALGLCLAAAPAIAETPSDVATTVVRFDDLNLASAAGAHTLQIRLKDAVSRVCGRVELRDLTAQAAVRACRAQAMQQVSPQIDLALANARKTRSYARAGDEVAPRVK